MIILLITSTLFVIFLSIYYFVTKNHDYWRKRNILYKKPVIILGNYGPFILLKKYLGEMVQSICQEFPKAPYIGAFYGTVPTLVVQEPEVIKLIMLKDFNHFYGRENSEYSLKEPILNNLFFNYGDSWKVLRQNLTPLFSTARLKGMFNFITQCAYKFEDILDQEVDKSKTLEVRPLMCRYTMSCIGSCAFGIDTESNGNVFTDLGKSIFTDSNLKGFVKNAKTIWPEIFYSLGMKRFSRTVDCFFQNVLKSVFESRDYQSSSRHDFADLLLDLRKEGVMTGDRFRGDKGNDKLSLPIDDELLSAQCLGFFGAGYETTSTTLHYALYELAKNLKVQEKAIEEVDAYLKRYNNKIDFECLTDLTYIEACIDEALRLYPVVGILKRETLEEYQLPCGAVLDKGVRIHIPIYHLHHNPEHFPEPENFCPERFLGEAKRSIKPYTYLPFGAGPRKCMGIRLAKMEMFPAMVAVLKKYRVELSEDTPRTLEFLATTLLTRSTKEIRLKLILRDDWEQRVFNKK